MAKDVIRKPRIRRPKHPPKLIVVHGGRELSADDGKALTISVSERMLLRQAERRIERVERQHTMPERRSVAIAMLAVEARLVRAFWTIARQPARHLAPVSGGRCGVDYVPDRGDFAGYADAAGGKWNSVAPRPPIPSGKEIDDANEALDWLLYLDEPQSKILVAGATSKRGDIGRQINWTRVKLARPELGDLSMRTLRGRYREAIRVIVNELTLKKLAR